MARKNFYDLLSNMKFSYTDEYSALICLFKEEKCVWNRYSYVSVFEYVDNHYFRSLPFRGSYLNVSALMNDLKLYDAPFVNLDSLFLLCEFLIAILPEEIIKHNADLEKQAQVIFENIFSILEKTNHKLFEIEENKFIVVENNKAATQAAEIVEDDNVSFDLIKYNHYALKGNLSEKKKILTSIGVYIEPILSNKTFRDSMYKNLLSDTRFVFNNFHIRHNNLTGPKAQEYTQSLKDDELENWYDKAYDLAIAVIIATECLPVQEELSELKKNYKWKT